jgi:hypothetical protein
VQAAARRVSAKMNAAKARKRAAGIRPPHDAAGRTGDDGTKTTA